MARQFLIQILILLVCCQAAVADKEPDYTFEGDATIADTGSYLYFDFDVPAETTKIYFQYGYQVLPPADAHHGAGGAAGILPGNTIDIGVFDPAGYRGWSGSNKSSFSIAQSAAHTSPSYNPGPIPAGIWQVELGIGWCEIGSTLHYHVHVTLSDEEVGETFVPTEYEPVVLSYEPGWYKGDLHCHSTHSDGSHPIEEVLEYAYSRGLDFLAPTEHNAMSHLLVLPDLQEDYEDMLLISGIEATTYKGHFNVFGLRQYVPYQGTAPGYDINDVIDDIHTAGGYMSPNHPVVPNIPVNGHLYGLGWGFLDTDWSKVDFMEAINGPMIVGGFIPHPTNLMAIEWWDKIQADGSAMTIRGGSDDHAAGDGGGFLDVRIGEPTTVVFAEELSETAILDGIAQGHCFLMTAGPDGAELYLDATDGKQSVIMGDTIEGQAVDLTARVVNGQGAMLSLYQDGDRLEDHKNIAVDSDDFTYTLSLAPEEPSRYRAEVWQGVRLLAITNSLYVLPDPGDDDDDDDDDDSEDDDDDDDDDSADEDDPGSSPGQAADDDDDDEGGCCG